MPRPNKILSPTKNYNLNIKIEDYDRLAKIAHDESLIHGQQVAVADLIRESIGVYLDALEEENVN
tara:strand:+ start:21529 stop:21723 length:195 start_codon:yes stop_codon:yes gene_type:complete